MLLGHRRPARLLSIVVLCLAVLPGGVGRILLVATIPLLLSIVCSIGIGSVWSRRGHLSRRTACRYSRATRSHASVLLLYMSSSTSRPVLKIRRLSGSISCLTSSLLLLLHAVHRYAIRLSTGILRNERLRLSVAYTAKGSESRGTGLCIAIRARRLSLTRHGRESTSSSGMMCHGGRCTLQG